MAVEGIDVTLSDGEEWRLAPPGLAPMLDLIRDELFDESVVRESVPLGPVLQVAWVCLLANYRLTDGELAALLTGLSDEQEQGLVKAVMDGLYGSGAKHVLPDVLELLLKTGRTVPQDEWISSVKYQAFRANLLAKFERAGIKAGAPTP